MATADRLKMPLEKVIINIDRYGNTTAGTIPLAMQTAVDEGKLKKGDTGAAGGRGGGIYLGSDAAALGFLKRLKRTPSGVPRSVVIWGSRQRP